MRSRRLSADVTPGRASPEWSSGRRRPKSPLPEGAAPARYRRDGRTQAIVYTAFVMERSRPAPAANRVCRLQGAGKRASDGGVLGGTRSGGRADVDLRGRGRRGRPGRAGDGVLSRAPGTALRHRRPRRLDWLGVARTLGVADVVHAAPL